jgi:hypothetical protein
MTADNAAIRAAVPSSFPRPLRSCRRRFKHRDPTTRATASLPGLKIEIVHRRPPGTDVEALSINMQAMPSFEAFGSYFGAANPFAFWAQVFQIAWLPWLGATRALTRPWGAALSPPQSHSLTENEER